MLRAFGCLVVSALAVACTKAPTLEARPESIAASAHPPAPVPAPAPPRDDAAASAASLASASAPPTTKEGIRGWKDPRAIALLEEDCAFVVPADVRELATRLGLSAEPVPNPFDSLICAGELEQSCVPDPCSKANCHDECQKRCETCTAPCVASCQACKTGCRDAACKKGCAESCASCRQSCNDGADRCFTGECSKREVACRKEFAAKVAKSGCKTICEQDNECRSECTSERSATAKCKKCQSQQVPARCNEWCMMMFPY